MGTLYDYESLCRRIRRMEIRKVIALSSACAEKVSPIVQALGLKRTCLLERECVEFMWSSPLQEHKTDEALRLLKAVESTAEWDCNGDNSLDLPKKSGREEKRSMLHLEESSGCQKIVVYLVPSINEKP